MTETANGKLQFEPQGEDSKGSTDKDDKVVKGSNTNIINNNNGSNRAEHWKSFIEKLRKLGEINSSIKEQQETLERIKKEIIELNKQKQDRSSQCQTAVSFIGLITKQIHYFNGLIDYHYNTATKRSRFIPPLSPLLINLICVNLYNQHKDDKTEGGKKYPNSFF